LCKDHDPNYQAPAHQLFDGLSLRQAQFVLYYCGVAKGNGTKAAKLAGYQCKDDPAFAVQASHLLSNPKVRVAVERRFKDLTMGAEEVLKRISDDARLDIAPLIVFDDNGNPKTKLTPEALEEFGTLIKEIQTDPLTGRVTRIKLNDSQAARRDLARILQLYHDGPVVNVNVYHQMTDDELREQLEAARRRVVAPRMFGKEGDGNGNGRQG